MNLCTCGHPKNAHHLQRQSGSKVYGGTCSVRVDNDDDTYPCPCFGFTADPTPPLSVVQTIAICAELPHATEAEAVKAISNALQQHAPWNGKQACDHAADVIFERDLLLEAMRRIPGQPGSDASKIARDALEDIDDLRTTELRTTERNT